MTAHVIPLRCGTLRVQVDRAELPLDELCGFASRRSRKRGFVFVSKVLGKHYPVRPCQMADVYCRLASKLGELPGPVVCVALAETAIGLGHGIAEAWQRMTGRDDMLFLHTTRYRLNRPLALRFDEAHSHATEHLLFLPDDDWFEKARTLVLIDDEMSTGRTLANLAAAYRQHNDRLASVHLVCITDWLGVERRQEIVRQVGVSATFHSLLEGTFTLEEDASFDPGPIPDAGGPREFKDACLPGNFGRLGVRGLLPLDVVRAARLHLDQTPPAYAGGSPYLVLGTGEFAYPPFLLAQQLEASGHDVFFQSTTRSPLLVDRDITSVLEFPDNYYDGISNYLYNVSDRSYDRIIIAYETAPLPENHRLAAMLGATETFF